MTYPSTAPSPGAARLRWRLVVGWLAFFALAIAGLVLAFVAGDGVPTLFLTILR